MTLTTDVDTAKTWAPFLCGSRNMIAPTRTLAANRRHFHCWLENDSRSISNLVALARELLIAEGILSEGDCWRVMGAVDEALQNAHLHGNLEVSSSLRDRADGSFESLAEQRRQRAPYRYRQIEFEMSVDEETVSFTIGDEGPGFDVSALPDPTAAPRLDRAHGRGVLMMRAFADEVRFNDQGNVVTLVKNR